MIRSKSEQEPKLLEIDLSGPDGNAFALMRYAQILGRKLGYTEDRIDAIIKVMRMSSYDGLVHTFDEQFGEYVILWK
jgi:hypothetical protein|tara:strand:+ start:235 stop:465 length:231 start_codon:yes stop_codon:yes gene_type:complete